MRFIPTLVVAVLACGNADPPPMPSVVTIALGDVTLELIPGMPCRDGAPPPGVFEESRAALGIDFKHELTARGPDGSPQVRDFGGVSIGDLDGDGALDLYFANSGGKDRVYVTEGRGPLAWRGWDHGEDGAQSGVVALVDLNGDGALDVLLGGDEPETRWSLGDGVGGFAKPVLFPQVATLDYPPPAYGFSAGDVDGDGWVDVCTATHLMHRADGTNWPGREWLSRNDHGVLVDDDARLPVSRVEDLSFVCSLIDLDDDGDLDLLETNDAWSLWGLGLDATDMELQGGRVLRNDGGSFTDVSAGSGADLKISAMGTAIGDYDNDGRLDLYITSMTPLPSALLKNVGDLKFTDRTYDADADTIRPEHDVGWGTIFVDADADGWLDLFVLHGRHLTTEGFGAGTIYNEDAQANVLLHNKSDGTFEDVTETARLGGPAWSRSPAAGDLNRDGFVDLVVGNTDGSPYVYLNGCDTGPWLSVSLSDRVSANTHGVGARIRVKAGEVIQTRVLIAGGDGLYGSSAIEANFGFPESTDSVDIEVRWPDGALTSVGGIPTRRHAIFRR